MSSAHRCYRIRTAVETITVLAAAGVFTALTTAPAPSADPGAPVSGCERQSLGSVCDSPIGPANTFNRCSSIGMLYIGKGRFLPARETCWTVDLNDDPDFGAGLPQHHIDG